MDHLGRSKILAMFLVNRKISAEAKDFFYSSVYFNVMQRPKALTFVSQPHMSPIRKVYVKVEISREQMNYYQGIFASLATLPNLQALVVFYNPSLLTMENNFEDLMKHLAECGIMQLAGRVHLFVWQMWKEIFGISYGPVYVSCEKIWVLAKGETEWKMDVTGNLRESAKRDKEKGLYVNYPRYWPLERRAQLCMEKSVAEAK